MKPARSVFIFLAVFSFGISVLRAQQLVTPGKPVTLLHPADMGPRVAGLFAKQLYSRTSFADAPILQLFFTKIMNGKAPIFCQFYADCMNAQALADQGSIDTAAVFADHAAILRNAANQEMNLLSASVLDEKGVQHPKGQGFTQPIRLLQINSTTGGKQAP